MASAYGSTNGSTNGATNGSTNGSHADESRQVELNGVDAERRRLEDGIAVAKRRAAASHQRIEAAEVDIREGLRAELLASKDALAAIERHHAAAVAIIRDAAQAEVQRILKDARSAPVSCDHHAAHARRNGVSQGGFSNAE